jgi:hypothetical protein
MLGLSGSFALSDAESCLAIIADLARAKPLTGLELRAVGAPLEARLIPLLNALQERGVITLLDVTGQAVGDSGLNIILLLAESCLRDLRCDGSKPKTYESLINVISRLAVSRLVSCEWPAGDVSEAEAKVPEKMRGPILGQLAALRETFNQRLNPEHGAKNTAPTEIEAAPTVRRSFSRGSRIGSHPSIASLDGIDVPMLTFRDEVVQTALSGLLGKEPLKEAVVDLWNVLEKKTSLEAYVENGGH